MHQVDAAGDGLDPVDRVDQFLAGRPGVAGVQAEPDAHVADAVPQPGDGVEVPGHCVVAARGVLQVDRDVGLQGVERLHPALETGLHVVVVGVPTVHDHRRGADLAGRVAGVLQDLARRDSHPVVGRGHVDQIRGVHVQRDRRAAQHVGVLAGLGFFPALRVAEEELDRVGVVVERAEKRVVGADVGTDEHDGQSRRGLRRPPPELIASSPRACAKSHSGSPIRASLRMLAEREKAPAHGRGFLVSDYR